MIDLESQLLEKGFSPEDVTSIVDVLEERHADEAREMAARFLHLVFLRVERDSAAGCALRRALGFSGGVSLARAARDFCVSKQYLEDLQSKLEAQLGELSFLARQARAAGATDFYNGGAAGPPGNGSRQR